MTRHSPQCAPDSGPVILRVLGIMTVPGSGGGVTDLTEEGVLGHDVTLTSLMSESHTLLSPLIQGLRVTESVGAGGHWPESGSTRAGGSCSHGQAETTIYS